MKIFIFVMSICFLLPVQPDDIDRYAYCESCLTAAREIEKALKEASPGRRQTVVESLLRGSVCERLPSSKQDKMTAYCTHLLEFHYQQFHSALVTKDPERLDIVLCYEQSTACVGVKRLSFEDTKKKTFTQGDIEALLRLNKENVRIAQPVHSASAAHSSDEL